MQLDYGRINDLELLAEGIKKAQSRNEKEYYEKIMNRIVNESTTIRSLRLELIGALRVNDKAKAKRIMEHIQYVRMNETRGTSWGSNKTERVAE